MLLDVQPGAALRLRKAGFASGRVVHLGAPMGREAASALEDASGGLRWLELALPVGSRGHTLTLHLRGDWDAGRLLFDRGRDHGLRVVGTLHAGLCVNVLALYEP